MLIDASDLPPQLVSAIEFNLGATRAKNWLKTAAESANKHAAGWGVSLETVLVGGALSLCVLGRNEAGRQVVMKIPSDVETGRNEIEALTAWHGVGAPRVIDSDPENSVFLMEYLVEDNRRIFSSNVFELADTLHSEDRLHNFILPGLDANVEMRIEWAEERFSDPVYAHLRSDLKVAKFIARRLLATSGEKVLLHGDFQRKNLVSTAEGLRTLDPHACIGEGVFDAAFWLGLVHHDRPIVEILNSYSADKASIDFYRFCCWTWVISVIENRPYQLPGAKERQHFIESFHSAVTAMAASL